MARLEDQVRITDELGRGAFGVVYRGERPTGAPVAVKLPLAPLDADGAARLAREVALLTTLDHPRLARLLGCWPDAQGRPGLVYELVEGEPLHQVLAVRRPTLDEVRAWVHDVAAGLDALAARGLVHRDLKPSNLILEPDGRVRLLDFGLARKAVGGTVTQEGMVLGTPAFMAPEQVLGAELSPACDVYALGVLAYCLLTGDPPFAGEPGEILRALPRQEPDPVSRRRGGLGPAVDAAVARALAKGPATRLVRELRRDLAEAVGWRRAPDGRPWKGDDAPADAPAFLDEDPIRLGQILGALPAVKGWVAWFEAGGRPEDLADAERAALAEADRVLADEMLVPVFRTFRELRPPAEPRPTPAAYEGAPRPPLGLGDPAEGWRWVVLDRLGEAFRGHARMKADVQRARPGDMPGGPLEEAEARALLLGRRIPRDYLEALTAVRARRVRIHPWVAPVAEAIHDVVYAAARELRSHPKAGRRIMIDACDFLGILQAAFFGYLEGLPRELLLGSAPRTPEEHLLAGKLDWLRAVTARHMVLEEPARFERHWAASQASYRSALEIPAGDDLGAELRAYAYGNLIEILVYRGEHDEAARVLDRWRRKEAGLGYAAHRRFLLNVLSIFDSARRSWALPLADLRWAVDEFVRRFREEEFETGQWDMAQRARRWLENAEAAPAR